MFGVTFPFDVSLEAVHRVRLVVHDPARAVRLQQRVRSLHLVAVAVLPLALVVTVFNALHPVLVLVLGVPGHTR